MYSLTAHGLNRFAYYSVSIGKWKKKEEKITNFYWFVAIELSNIQICKLVCRCDPNAYNASDTFFPFVTSLFNGRILPVIVVRKRQIVVYWWAVRSQFLNAMESIKEKCIYNSFNCIKNATLKAAIDLEYWNTLCLCLKVWILFPVCTWDGLDIHIGIRALFSSYWKKNTLLCSLMDWSEKRHFAAAKINFNYRWVSVRRIGNNPFILNFLSCLGLISRNFERIKYYRWLNSIENLVLASDSANSRTCSLFIVHRRKMRIRPFSLE